MAHILIDSPATDLKFLESLKSCRCQYELPKLIKIGSCPLHIIHGVFKSGTEATSSQLKAILKSVFNLLHESATRREDFTSRTGSN